MAEDAAILASDDLASAELRIGYRVRVGIHPGSCHNPLNVKSKGVLPVAVFGQAALKRQIN